MLYGIISRCQLHNLAGKQVEIKYDENKNHIVIIQSGEICALEFFNIFFANDNQNDEQTAEFLNMKLADITRALKELEAAKVPVLPPSQCYTYNNLNQLTKKELVKLLIKETTNKGLIRGPEEVDIFLKEFTNQITDWNKEHFIGLYLNTKNFVIHAEIISIGHLTASLVHPREVFKPALKYSAAALIVGHNHPSGDPEPSTQDNDITQMLKSGGDFLGIKLLDHIIFSNSGKYYSYNEKGKL